MIKKLTTVFAIAGISAAASAQVLDLQTGRSADLTGEPATSVEGGLVIGDADYIGARGNYLVMEDLLVSANLGLVDIGDDELAIGVDGMYQVPIDFMFPVAVKVGFGVVPDGDVDFMALTLEAIISGDIADGIGWYANAGIHWVDTEVRIPGTGRKNSDDDVVPAFGGGVVFDVMENAAAFAGIDVLLGDLYDDTVLGGGFRWGF